jgi:membrane-bound lytic murein transglycosylase D
VLDSTRAALDYLTKLHGMFGDWHLALAAYNWGEGNVQRAVRANERARRGTDYPSLRMPLETRDYVPKLQAVVNIVADPARFGLTLPPLENHPYFLAVPIARDIDVELAAKLAQLPLTEFRSLNPQMNKPVIVAAGTPQVLLPYDNANHFVKAVAQHAGPLASWTAWVAPRTMKTADAARQVGMAEAELRDVNDIPPRMLVKAGSTLLVPRHPHRDTDDVPERLAAGGTLALAADGPALRRVSVRVGKQGDSVSGVARRFGVPAQSVAQWNQVSANARFAAGSTVVVYVTPKAPQRADKPSRAPAKPARNAARKR